MLVVCGLTTKGAGRVTFVPFPQRPEAALWAVSTTFWTYGVVYHQRHRQYRVAG